MFDIATLSVCIISRNEERCIEKCIKSVKKIADEIILVDTGSEDNTVNIAMNLGAKVIKARWNNDFSEIRNISINHAVMEWILILDCDEELKNGEEEKLQALIKNKSDYIGYYIKIQNIINNRVNEEHSIFRLFKNNKKYKFKGRLHEEIVNSIIEIEGKEKIGISNIQVLHYGYDYSIVDINEKSNRNLNILLSYNKKDKNGYYYYVLGNEFARINNNSKAINNYKKSLNFSNEDIGKVYYPYLLVNLCKILYKERQYLLCISIIDEFIKKISDLKDLYFIRFLCCIECMKIDEAKKSLKKYLDLKEENRTYPHTNFGTEENIKSILVNLDTILFKTI